MVRSGLTVVGCTFARHACAGAVLPYITAAKAAGCTSLRQIAEALTSRGIRTPGGGTTWVAEQVNRVLRTAPRA